MFTYIQITSKLPETFKGYVDYEFTKDELSMTLIRGMKTLRRINIPISEITDLRIDKFYGEDRVRFFYDNKEYSIINSGYGESNYFEKHIIKAVNA